MRLRTDGRQGFGKMRAVHSRARAWEWRVGRAHGTRGCLGEQHLRHHQRSVEANLRDHVISTHPGECREARHGMAWHGVNTTDLEHVVVHPCRHEESKQAQVLINTPHVYVAVVLAF